MTQVLRGKIEPLALVDVLAYLGRNKESGILNALKEGVKKSLIIHEGNIVFARSNQVEDRLGDMLLAQGLISQEEYDQGTNLIYEKGFRHGRALVEIGAISPKVLWQKIQDQVQTIACSIIPWDCGDFEFVKQELKHKESITLSLNIIDMVLDVVRNLDNRDLFKTRFPDVRQVPGLTGALDLETFLEPHEAHLLKFIDGHRSIAQICEDSDYGEAESLRVLYLLQLLGSLLTLEREDDGSHPLVTGFNKMFAYLHRYLGERVGPVGTNLLKKYLDDIRGSQPEIFEGVALMADGRLDPAQLQRNMRKIPEEQWDLVLDEAMNEYLNMAILAVKKVLGTEHESIVIKEIGSIH